MKVTKVIIDNYKPKENGSCADATVVIDNSLAIHNIGIIKGLKGYFVAYPNTGVTKMENGKKKYCDLIHPICKTLSEEISSKVLNAFNEYSEKIKV